MRKHSIIPKKNGTRLHRRTKVPLRSEPEDPLSLEGNIVRLALNGDLAKISRTAIQKQVDRGIPVTFKRGRRILKRHADGRVELLGNVPPTKYRLPAGVRIIGKK